MNPLDLAQWEFFVFATKKINDLFGNQKTVAISRIRDCCSSVAFADLREKIDDAIDRLP